MKGSNQMKKGFTLIELLATIVIISIIALITTPAILNVINDARKNTFKQRLNSLINTVDLDYTENARTGEVTYEYKNNTLTCIKCDKGSNLDINFTGEIKNGSGTIIKNKNDLTINITNSRYQAEIENGKLQVK